MFRPNGLNSISQVFAGFYVGVRLPSLQSWFVETDLSLRGDCNVITRNS